MKNRFFSVLICLLAAIMLTVPTGILSAPLVYADERGVLNTDEYEYYIKDYKVNVVANPDRSYDVTEIITVYFNIESRGITRDIPSYGSAEKYEIVDLRANGDPYTDMGTGSIRIGDPDIYLKGEKVYNITYTLEHFADPETAFDYFYFNIVGTEWDTVIQNFSAEIKLPDGAEVNKITLTGGRYGSKDEVAEYTLENGTIYVNGTSWLEEYSGATINAELNQGAFYEAKEYQPRITVNSIDCVAEIDNRGIVNVTEKYTVTLNDSGGIFRREIQMGSDRYYPDTVTVITPHGTVEDKGSHGSIWAELKGAKEGVPYSFELKYSVDLEVRAGGDEAENASLYLLNEYREYWYENVKITYKAPFTPRNADVYFGNAYDKESDAYTLTSEGGTVIFESLKRYTETDLSLNIWFYQSDFVYTPGIWDYIAPIGAFGLLITAIVFLLKRREKPIVPSVQFYPPEGINPAEAAYICKDDVSGRDMTSLVYHWASHGHLSIEMQDDEHYVLHRGEPLDDGHDAYEAVMYSKMFMLGDGDRVDDSDLSMTFYKQIEKAQKGLKGYFSGERKLVQRGKRSTIGAKQIITMGVFFGTFGIICAGIITAILSHGHGSFLATLPLIVPGWIFVKWLSGICFNRRYSGKSTLTWLVLTVAVLIGGLQYLILNGISGGYSLSPVTCMVIPVVLMTSAVLWPRKYCKTDYAVDLLGQILGFKTFVQMAEKQQLEMLLEQNPEYFYNTLPYAQTLGLSKIWEKKFDGMLMQPPTWLYGQGLSYVNLSHSISTLNKSMGSNMTSAPYSSSGGGGFSGGGSGFSGGGFSGGGSSGGGSGGGGGGRW